MELLVVMAILAVLMGILGTTLGKVRGAARSVLCKNKLQSVTQKFRLFADDYGHPDRGAESERLGPKRFRLEDFQDYLYGTEEFWDANDNPSTEIKYAPAKQPMMCPAGPRLLVKRGNMDLAAGVITPIENVSVGLNMRLHRANVALDIGPKKIYVLRDVTLNARALDHPWTPLAFDVDGVAASRAGKQPFYAAPALAGEEGQYAGDNFWFPAFRHNGQIHAAFLGGHVWSSSQPKKQADWDWSYQPPPEL